MAKRTAYKKNINKLNFLLNEEVVKPIKEKEDERSNSKQTK